MNLHCKAIVCSLKNYVVALALSKLSYNVGLLDADIYGPSLPTMMNLTNKKVEVNSHNNLLEPLYNYNIKCMSMGFLTKSDGPVVWRGLMVMSAIEKMLKQVNWKPLDYLVIDMPPGTGDIQLSISQLTSISGIVIVTTPQEISVIDVRKAIGMFQLVNVPILGIIENMSTYTCQKCSHEEHIFGVNGGTNLAKEFKTTVLEFLPINISFRQACDEGKPYVIVNDSDDQMIRKFETIAQKIVKQIPIKQNEQVEQK
ncbi:unnamed protein product [Didymodactylos carnosus]|uniref:Uncharacterized protein n=1 Tax=Didymodactylos carnosus TaxID=1234261 RepID=A0A813X197_9BILA|nr:unnamed protein product [Didymodactylos carnosus]CAF1177291.1 unnamed protein product [Didymodactylos carnosus]CAF3651233.1 unnamed protein product [Didymodactylos carnosus]CAF3988567.1 unnamed protein product [Didymodactylos carnosus]